MTPENDPKPRSRASRRLRDGWRRLTPGLESARAAVRRWRLRMPAPVRRILRRATRWSLHSVLGVTIAIVLLFVAARLGLPMLVENKADIERFLSTAAGSPAHIDRIEAFWDNKLNPGVRVQGLRLESRTPGVTAVHLREVRLSLSWWALLTGRIEINSLVLVEPSLTVEHLADGRFRLTGLDLPAPDPAQEDFSTWLLRQRRMEIENGHLVWIDHLLPGATEERLDITHVAAALLNEGDRHRLDLRATFPQSLCGSCRVIADVRGNPLRADDWSGDLTVRAQQLSLSALPHILQARLPSGLDGRINARLESHWTDGRPERVRGSLVASRLSIPVSGVDQPLVLQSLDTMLDWQGDRQSGRLDLARLSLGLTRAPWLSGRVRFDYAPDRIGLEVEHVNVGDVAAFVNRFDRPGAAFDWLRVAQPEGGIDRLNVALDGPWTQPNDMRVSADVRGLQFAAYERIPGMTALTGRIETTGLAGEFRLDTGASRIQLPRVFRDPIEVQRLTSRISWKTGSDHWTVQASDLKVQNADGRARGDVAVRIPFDRTQSPVMDLDIAVPDGTLAHAERYYPLVTPGALRNYLDRAVAGGRLTGGRVRFQGALRQFPFRDGKGRFTVDAHVRDGVYEFLPGWEPLRDVESDLHFTGVGLEITVPHATLHGMDVGRLTIGIDDFLADDGAVVTVSGRVNGAMSDILDVLAGSHSPRVTPYLITGLRAAGNGVLTLGLEIPTHDPAAVRIDGDYRLQGGSLAVPFRSIRAEALRGWIGFDESGLRAGQVQGRLLGGDTQMDVNPSTDRGGGVRVDLHGTVAQEGFNQVFGSALAASFVGEVPWTASVALRRERPEWEVRADLRPLQIGLPAPLAKARDQPLVLAVRNLPAAGANQQLVDLQAEGRVTGRLAFARAADGWSFDRGHIGIGERITQLPGAPGLQLSARLPSLNADNWWKLLRATRDASGTAGWFDYVSQFNAEVDAVEVFGRLFGHQVVDLAKVAGQGQWRGTVRGDSVSGRIDYRPAGCGTPEQCATAAALEESASSTHPTISLQLDQLVWPPARAGTGDSAAQAVDPRELPNLSIQSAAFSARGLSLGALGFRAEPTRQGWQITTLTLTTAETTVAAHGSWEIDWQAKQACHLIVSLTSKDFGRTLAQLGYPDELAGGELSLNSQWSWSGMPADWSLAGTTGDLTMRMVKGRLVKVSPGAGRILGVLDLRSLTRYLTLDLSSIFGKGMTFDNIRGNFDFSQGNAFTRDLEIRAPGADMDVNGRIGLIARDLDLDMRVTPRLGEELAIGGAIVGGPAVGAAVAVIHKLVQKPFEKNTRIRYTVRGSWDDPAVERVGSPPVVPPDPIQP